MTPLQTLTYKKIVKRIKSDNPIAKYCWIFHTSSNDYCVVCGGYKPKWMGRTLANDTYTYNWYKLYIEPATITYPLQYITGPFSEEDLKDSLVEV